MSYKKLGFVSGQTLKAEHLNHMEEGIAKAGSSVSWDDLNDKPFGKTIDFKSVFEFIGVEAIVDEYSNGAAFYYDANAYLPFNIGDAFIVELNGVQYETTVQNFYFGDYLGNQNLAWALHHNNTYDGTGLPFGILNKNGVYLIVPEAGTYDLKICISENKVKTIDTEFLHYKYPKITYTENTLVDNFAVEADSDYWYAENPFDLTLVLDTRYKVVFDDKEYELVCKKDEYDYLFIGTEYNDAIPFRVSCGFDDYTNEKCVYLDVAKAGTHSITIVEYLEDITPIHKSLVTNIVSGDYVDEFGLKETNTLDDALHKIVANTPSASIKRVFSYDEIAFPLFAYGNYKYVAVSEFHTKHNVVLYSDNGVDWKEATLPVSKYWVNILYGNDVFVLLGNEESGNTGVTTILYSLDGINWNVADVSSCSRIEKRYLSFINGKFYACESNGYFAICSEDGMKWNDFSGKMALNYRSIAYGNGTYVSFNNRSGASNSLYSYSTDEGMTWTSKDIDTNYNVYEVCFGNDKFIAFQKNGKEVIYSYNGIDWLNGILPKDYDNNTNNIIVGVCYDGDMFIAYDKCTHDFLYSENGIEWKAIYYNKTIASFIGSSIYDGGLSLMLSDGKIIGRMYDNNSNYALIEVNTGNYFDLAKNSDIEEKFATKEYVATMAILTSPNGTKYRLTVADDGTLSAVAVE